jgi:hypothetical protein
MKTRTRKAEVIMNGSWKKASPERKHDQMIQAARAAASADSREAWLAWDQL